MELTICIFSYWRVGNGIGLTGSFDVTCARDADGLPYVPGRQLRGLLREAVTDAAELGWIDENAEDLFGSRPKDATAEQKPQTTPGKLRIEDARFPRQDRLALQGKVALIDRLFLSKRSTAIDRKNGIAQNRSLRLEEVAIPMELTASISALEGAPDNWRKALKDAIPLIRGLGSGRNRGLGRCRVTETGDLGLGGGDA